MKKQAQGISIDIIIIAAIALIALVVLIAIFTGRIGSWGKAVTTATGDPAKTCDAQYQEGYHLISIDQCTALGGGTIASSDTAGTMVCCTKRIS